MKKRNKLKALTILSTAFATSIVAFAASCNNEDKQVYFTLNHNYNQKQRNI
ncbi:hypothetical protein [Mycoplasmopsis fermentans]|uniref:Lipoprotein n=1 Tax=Mycoplasmopsis fermentans (strain M64) TaxID=943945 RepID=A0AB32XCC1_MYCFM|nr:hypothetical protein [Mycoplasmopsis fermentans]ADN69150.1 hypothetical protein MFE_05660 [Mycoplasmopsis fermentans JER]ADV34677.1 Hypothetical Protein MfeM64YM_0679 [Mycoplasmopsis fermentans M64]